MKRKRLITTLAISAGTLAVSAAAGYYAMSEHLYTKMIKRKNKAIMLSNPEDNDELYYFSDLKDEVGEWLERTTRENVYITSQDGLELAGEWFHPETDSHRWIFLLRGNDVNSLRLHNVAMAFQLRGYHVLLADARGYGNSEGQAIGLGWQDRLDIQSWLAYIADQDKDASIALYGISLSAPAVMIAGSEPLPANVRCIIEDSGFTSAYDFLSEQIKQDYGFRASLIMEGLDTITRIRAKYSLKSASAIRHLRKSALPVMFIHGEEDEFVPLDHVFRLYHACTTDKELYTVPYAGHGEAMFSPRYYDRIFLFLDHHMNEQTA